ncbi:MAG: hypothetical protein ACETWE_02315 [Candidatus Bathyarchaeia archaeon]
MELRQIFEIQRDFDRRMGWDRYEKCETPEEILDFMKHYVIVTVEELGEICEIRKETERDRQILDIEDLKEELVDIFIYLMQACMAANMDLEEGCLMKMKQLGERWDLTKP